MMKRYAFLAVLLWSLGGLAADSAAVDDYDEEEARDINYTCAGCHGEFGQGTADGTYPRLAGLDADYLARQMRLFKSRERLNIPMFPYATERELPEEDVILVSRYLSSIKLISRLPPINEATYDPLERLKLAKQVFAIPRYAGDIENGKQVYNKQCASCHGRDGLGKRREKAAGGGVVVYPRLSGQHSLYLLRQIEKIGKGTRFHDEKDDAAVFSSYTRKEIDDVLAYLSTLDDQ